MRIRFPLVAAALLLGFLVVGPGGSAAEAREQPPPVNDPGRPGPYRTTTGAYELPPVAVPDLFDPVDFGAVVVAPVDAPGPLPVVLLLHGHYPSCSRGPGPTDGSFAWPCLDGYRPTLSSRGFLPVQELLAAQGFLTVSITANAVDAQDWEPADGGARARSSLVRQHLARLAGWAAGEGDVPQVLRAVPPADLSRVVLVGHSRGGDGVSRAAMDTLHPSPEPDAQVLPVRWRIRGIALIGPTSFGHNPVEEVPSMSLLPGCDGDAARLEGQVYVDGTRGVGRGVALHSAVHLAGANHNWFNTEWTPGLTQNTAWDDFTSATPDRLCTPGTAPERLTAAEQRAAGATYLAAAARLFGLGDDSVLPLLDGSGARAPSAGRAVVRAHALGGNRVPLVTPDPSVTTTGARVCLLSHPDPAVGCALPEGSPHANAVFGMRATPGRHGAAMRWGDAGAAATFRPARPVSLAGAREVALRVVVPPNSTGTHLEVAVTAPSGRREVLGQVRLDGLPGTANTYSAWAQEVRLPLRTVREVAVLSVVPTKGSGSAWLLDAWGWSPGTADAPTTDEVRVDLGSSTVDEGDDGTRALRVPATVSGTGTGQVWLSVRGRNGPEHSALVPVAPGTNELELPLTVTGDRRYGPDREYTVQAWAARDAVIGAYRATVTVRNDDPPPAIGIAAVADDVTEGAALSWRITLSEPLDDDLDLFVSGVPTNDGPELSTVDVDPGWLAGTGNAPLPERPLARLLGYRLVVPAGTVSVDLTVPTVRDDVAEPAERLRLSVNAGDRWLGPVTATVRDQPAR
ncbi:hypothetical protein Val02_21960 [Virgisporangium aliadipatigenens]|uniref:Secreted protein n=1 Tax=Virgisporangium aliadipatigenens TaxID=741659 RepID=A0A8J4DNV9_9ACTN|nr:hypothetical protein [Virgisporangium aliadipatigenens]GIJ45310.1 hypothetical protein Val02_21960 [Virgisporangium aliadipatigenens]